MNRLERSVSSVYYSFLICLLIFGNAIPKWVWAQSHDSLFTTVKDIRSLSGEDANQGYPVSLEGIITYCWPSETPQCFFQDATGGIFIHKNSFPLFAGAHVKISGHTIQGWFAPDIASEAEIQLLGKKPLPEPSRESPYYFFTGKEDASIVEIDGVIRSAKMVESQGFTHLELKLNSYGNKNVRVMVNALQVPDNIIGAFVRVQGVASGEFSIDRQFISPTLWVPEFNMVKVLRPGDSNPFQNLPLTPIYDIFTFSLDRKNNQHIHLGGVVTYSQGGVIIVKDETGSVYVEVADTQNVHLNEWVEIAGFPAVDNMDPHIEDALIRSHGMSPELPIPVRLDTSFQISNLSLVNIEARLSEVIQIDSTVIYKLVMPPYRFDAKLVTDASAPLPRAGSILKMTGIAEMQYNPRNGSPPEINPVLLLLRNEKDIAIISPGPWWSSSHTRWLIIGLLFVVALIVSWMLILKRQIHTQTETIRNQLKEVNSLKEEAEIASRAKSTFLASMSHEIRTPLNGVIGFTSLMQDTQLDEEQQEFLRTIHTSGEALLGIINDILDFSKIEAGKLDLETHPFPIHRCVEEALDIVSHRAQEKGLELAYYIAPTVPVAIVGDITRLRQIIINLLSNATKFTHKGEITVWVNAEPTDQHNTHRIRFSVKDSGIGIPANKLDNIFDTFTQADSSTTRQFGGTGLGLAICKRLSTLMGGTIKVESTEGEGSTFSFDIVVPSVSDQEEENELQNLSALEGRHVLIVDDNETNRKLLNTLCRKWGMHCTTVSSAHELLELTDSFTSFDLVLLDYMMPNFDGFQLANTMRAQNYVGGIIILSSHGDRLKSESNVFDRWLHKPIKQKVLLDAILKYFAGDGVNLTAKDHGGSLGIHHPLRIALVEGNRISQKIILKFFNQLQYDVNVFYSPSELIEQMESSQFDVILIDLQAPLMDGISAAHQIFTLMEHPPRILATSLEDSEEIRAACKEAGFHDFLPKPFRKEALMAALISSERPDHRMKKGLLKNPTNPEKIVTPDARP